MAIQQTAMKSSDTEVPDVETFETIVIGGGGDGRSGGENTKQQGGAEGLQRANHRKRR